MKIFIKNKICNFSEILEAPDFWIFHVPKIRPQIGFPSQIRGQRTEGCTVNYNLKVLKNFREFIS